MNTMAEVDIVSKPLICLMPSTAEVIETGGVIMPSARSAAPPSVAGKTSHFRLLRTSAYKLKIPPSPLLSAFSVKITYFSVVCKLKVQMIQDKEPRIKGAFTT